MIEIVERATCPTCGGKRSTMIERHIGARSTGEPIVGSVPVRCTECDKYGAVPRVLATFADAAELIERASRAETMELGRVGPVVARAVLAAMGVSDDQG